MYPHWVLRLLTCLLLLAGCAAEPSPSLPPEQVEPLVSLRLEPCQDVVAAVFSAARQAGRSVVVNAELTNGDRSVDIEGLDWRGALEGVELACSVEWTRHDWFDLLARRERFSLTGSDANLFTCLELAATYGHLGVVLEPGAISRFTVPNWKEIPYRDALDRLAGLGELVTRVQGEVLLVRPRFRWAFHRPHAQPWRSALVLTPRADCRAPLVDLELQDAPLANAVAAITSAGLPVSLGARSDGRDERVTLLLRGVPGEQAVELLAWLSGRRIERRPDGLSLVAVPDIRADFRQARMDRALEALARAAGRTVLLPEEGLPERVDMIVRRCPADVAIPAAAEVWDLQLATDPSGGWRVAWIPQRPALPRALPAEPAADLAVVDDTLEALALAVREGADVERELESFAQAGADQGVHAREAISARIEAHLAAWPADWPAPLRERLAGWLDLWRWIGRALFELASMSAAIRQDEPQLAIAARERVEAVAGELANAGHARQAAELRDQCARVVERAERLAAFLARCSGKVQGTIEGAGVQPLAIIDDRIFAPGERLPGPDGQLAADVLLVEVKHGLALIRAGDLEMLR